MPSGVVELFITEVAPDQEAAYRAWLHKIHEAESKFKGFVSMHVQAPLSAQHHRWVTHLQFDTVEHLDRWLTSKKREQLLEEGRAFVKSLERHRVLAPFSGWFPEAQKNGAVAAWKQTMLVLLVLFPIVMLELKYLLPHLTALNLATRTFIGNALSVTLISWPLMPLAIWFLGWWLRPQSKPKPLSTLLGTLIVLALYLIEIACFWN